MKAVTSAQMKRIDLLAQKRFGIPSIILMENAGREAAEEILKRFPAPGRDLFGSHKRKTEVGKKWKAAIFCGRGNNGGDGFVCARYLGQRNIKTDVFLLGRRAEIKNRDPLTNLVILEKTGTRITEIVSGEDLEKIKRNFNYDFIVDAIFGIGFKGPLPKEIGDTIDFLNKTGKPIYALDVPSGLDATTGKAPGICVTAHETITFGMPKTGFLRKEAKPYTNRVIVKEIGFPRELLK